MITLARLYRMIRHPRQTSHELVKDPDPRSALKVVLALGICMALMFGISAWAQDYPPAPDVLQTWINAYGEFGILPFLKIPAENYRLVLAVISIPLSLACWMLMAGTARLISLFFGGRVTFDQYLNLFGYSFFAFWILAHLVEICIEGLGGAAMLPSLRGEYGPLAYNFFVYSLPVGWVLLLSLGGAYNGLVTYFTEKFSGWKAATTGMLTMAWPIVLVLSLLR